MASKVDQLLAAFETVVNEPWSTSLSGQEKVWFLVYDPAGQRKVDLRVGDFEIATVKAGRKWAGISLKKCFPTWMANHEYREEYFADPEALVDQLEVDFRQYVVNYLNDEISKPEFDGNTLIAIRDVTSIYGFARLSDILNGISKSVKGRILVFFPGEFEQNHYRLLDARDGWSYLARPIFG